MPDNEDFPEFPHQDDKNQTLGSQVEESEPQDFRDSLAFSLIFFIGSVVALVFFDDTLREYGIGPRGTDVSLMSAHTLAIIFAVVFGCISLMKIVEWFRNR